MTGQTSSVIIIISFKLFYNIMHDCTWTIYKYFLSLLQFVSYEVTDYEENAIWWES